MVLGIRGRGGTVSAAARSHAASCIAEWRGRGGNRSESEGGRRSHFETWMNRRLPQTSGSLGSAFFSLLSLSVSLSLLLSFSFDFHLLYHLLLAGLFFIAVGLYTLKFFPNNGGHPAVACNTGAARRWSEDDAPPIRIMTNHPSPLFSSTCIAIFFFSVRTS